MLSWRKVFIIPAIALLSLSLSVTAWAQYRHKKLFEDRYMHEPVASEQCTVCHDLHSTEPNLQLAGQLRKSIPGLCFECHENPASGKLHVHNPVRKGQCLACHYPHSSSRPSLVSRSMPQLCIGCHKGKAGGRHGERLFGEKCAQCHDPHASESVNLLKGGLKGDCGSCHPTVSEGAYLHSAIEDSGCPECHDPHSSTPVATVPCLQCHADLVRGSTVHEPVEDGCETCHLSHSGPEPLQLIERLPDLCIDCHEEMIAGKHGKVNVGQDCTRCHSPHSSDGQALLTDSVRRAPCASCHVEIILKKIPHTPVSTNRCKRCHNPHSEPPVPTSLCRDCHGGIMDGRYDHEAAVDGCDNCHDTHGSQIANNLMAPVPELCTDCHDNMEGGRHGDVLLSEDCGQCHDPHSALQPNLLTMLKEKASCSTCHRPQSEGQVVHTPVRSGGCDQCHEPHTDPPVKTIQCTECHTAVTKGRFRHDALEEGCDVCHDTHTSGQNSLLSSGIPDLCLQCHDDKIGGKHGKTTLNEDCGSCHEPHNSARKGLLRVLGDRSCVSCHSERESGQYVHSALKQYDCQHCHDPHADPLVMPPMECQSCHPNMADRSVSHGSPSRGRCLECHNPHSADSAASIQKEEGSEGRDACLECHRDIARKLVKERTVHSPVSGDKCDVCHTNHSGEPPFTKLSFKKTKYVPYDPGSYELCFSCHPSSLAQVKYTETDTGFRQGRWNLHNLHVIRDGERGFSCWVCHDAHASDQLHLVNRELPMNPVYSLKIEFRNLDKGGECRSNCHTVKEYLR